MSDLPWPAPGLNGEPETPVTFRRATAADTPCESIGEALYRARQRSGKTLMQFSLELKIAPHHLIAIENNAFHELPGRAYAIGFVKSYATRLALDSEALVARLKAEMAAKDANRVAVSLPQSAAPVEHGNFIVTETAVSSVPEPAAPLFARPDRGVPAKSSPDLTMRPWIMAGVMVAAVMYFAWSMISSAAFVAPPRVTPVPARLAAETGRVPRYIGPPQPVTPVIASRAQSFATIASSAPPQAPSVTEQARIAHDLSLAPSERPAPPAIASAEQPPPVVRESVLNPPSDGAAARPVAGLIQPQQIADQPLPEGESYGEQNRGSRITLRVHRPTLVAVLGNRNHVFIDRILRAGDTYHVPNMRGLKLNAADAGAVELLVDNRTIGFAGEDGVAARGLPLQTRSVMNRPHRLQD